MEDKPLLFITFNENEQKAMLDVLENAIEYFDQKRAIKIIEGDFGIHHIFYYHCPNQGDNAELNMLRVLTERQYCAVIMVGIACGSNVKEKESEQKIGDVLLCKKLVDAREKRLGKKTLSRGDQCKSGDRLFEIFFGAKDSWQNALCEDGSSAKVYDGTLISGSELIDNDKAKKRVFELFQNEPIGYEMEGTPLVRVCKSRGVEITEWIIIKGISDFGDGSKGENKEKRQLLAARNAVSFCLHVFTKYGFDSAIKREYNNLKSMENITYTKKKSSKYLAEVKCSKNYAFPPRNSLFYGRLEQLKLISENLETHDFFIISAKSGTGKSELAKEFVYVENKYSNICWIKADRYEVLMKELINLSEFFKISISKKESVMIEQIKNYFENITGNIFIIDNANDFNMRILKAVLPSKNTKIIVTSQNSTWDNNEFNGLLLEDFTEDEAKDFLLNKAISRSIENEDNENAIKLVRLLYCFPFAIELARGYINSKKISISTYIMRINDIKILDIEHDKSAMMAWNISIASIKRNHYPSYEFLCKCSILEPFSVDVKQLFLVNSEYTLSELDKIIEILESFSLVKTKKEDTITMHPLTQKYIRIELKENGKFKLYAERQISILTQILKGISMKNREMAIVYLRHAQSAILYANSTCIEIDILYKFIDLVTSIQYDYCLYRDIPISLKSIMKKINESSNKISSIIKYELSFLTRLFMAYHFLGEHKEAKINSVLAIEKLENSRNLLDNDYYICASRIYNSKGIILKDEGKEKVKESLKYYNCALNYAEQANDYEVMINILMNIGIAYKHLEKYEDAILKYDKAIKLSKKINNTSLEMKTMANMAVLYYEQKNDKALELFNVTLEYFKSTNDLRSICITLDRLGSYYLEKSDYDNSYKYLQSSLKIATENNYAIYMAISYYNLGKYYDIANKNTNLALDFLTKCYDLSVKISYHPGEEEAKKYIDTLRSKS